MHWARLEASALGSLIAACFAWKRRVPNVTAHPSTANVPITVLLYDGPLLSGFNMAINPLMGTGNYNAISNNMKLVHWPLMGGLLRLVQR